MGRVKDAAVPRDQLPPSSASVSSALVLLSLRFSEYPAGKPVASLVTTDYGSVQWLDRRLDELREDFAEAAEELMQIARELNPRPKEDDRCHDAAKCPSRLE